MEENKQSDGQDSDYAFVVNIYHGSDRGGWH